MENKKPFLEYADTLSVSALAHGLKTKLLGRNGLCMEETDSTNEEAKRQGKNGAPDGSIFLAECQTDGKGRLGRNWSSPKGTGLWFSLLSRTQLSSAKIANMTLIAGLAICKAIRRETNLPAMIKWPNDIVIGNKKVCGILMESAVEGRHVSYIITGIGVNVNTREFPPELSEKATSLFLETGNIIPRIPLLQSILLELEKTLEDFENKPDHFYKEYKELCVSLYKRVQYFQEGKAVYGNAVDISSEGELIVKQKNGEMHAVFSGEVLVQGIYGENF